MLSGAFRTRTVESVSSPMPAHPGAISPGDRSTTVSSTSTYISIHDQRIALVADAIRKNSKLDEQAAVTVAGHVLDALDHIPEKVR